MQVAWWSMIPFVIMLLAIATAPLIEATRHSWEKQRVQLQVALVLGIPVALWFLIAGEGGAVAHALVEYGQFIALLLALFVVSGGIFLEGDLRATPKVNTAFLAVGGVLASFIGTTGAAMLLIRPLLNTNRGRTNRVHTVVFCIFIVANCGGLLTPLGDPPLFLGLLRGVPFLWTFNLFPEWLFVNILLLITFLGLDRRFYALEPAPVKAKDAAEVIPLRIKGGIHFLYLGLVVAAVAFAPSVDLHAIESGHGALSDWIPWREIIMLSVSILSLRTGDRTARYVDNNFKWGPIQEVAALFIGIFLTMIPALRYLAQVAPSLPLNEVTFFFFTGGLSAVLDNAPTYLTFFEMARELGGDPAVAGVYEPYLVAISLGAVFCGAITYIGNGPNFMVKAVADSQDVAMPSFGGYVVLAFRYLVPVLLAMVLIFIADPGWAHLLGWVLTALLLIRALRGYVMSKFALSKAHR
ncbi:MAG: sodium:proton antiporter [Ornithinimicrobium sp.]|uniref:sodium:proton antiporter n=1 Tax=Ornithinimicrobium sp. TaxID=1977084 RepID=UPI0026E0419B|nr:sodium:proton antiporter [Ornithinimicrobium sp.]MDO5739678.1 sodium:proton antiporter [Ornithinimicrobium sp.]